MFPIFGFIPFGQVLLRHGGQVVPLIVMWERIRKNPNYAVLFLKISKVKILINFSKGKDSIEWTCSAISRQGKEFAIISRKSDAMQPLKFIDLIFRDWRV